MKSITMLLIFLIQTFASSENPRTALIEIPKEEQEEFKKFTEEEYQKVRRTKSEPVMLSRTIKP